MTTGVVVVIVVILVEFALIVIVEMNAVDGFASVGAARFVRLMGALSLVTGTRVVDLLLLLLLWLRWLGRREVVGTGVVGRGVLFECARLLLTLIDRRHRVLCETLTCCFYKKINFTSLKFIF